LTEGVASPADTSYRWKNVPWIILRVAFLAVAILLLRRELDGVGLNGLLTSIRSYDVSRIELGIGFTAASFLTLGVIELLALRYVGKRAERLIPRRTAVATAFVASAYSQSVGLAILTGTAVRVRSYSRYCLDALDVTRLSVFVTATATLGLLTTGGFAFLTAGGRITLLGAPRSLAPLGILLLIPIVGYLAWGAFGSSDFYGRGRWRIRRPVFRVALQQIGVSSLDWALAGTVLFVLVPRSLHISYGDLLGIYLVAQTAAVLSHVPGGVGVFEAIVMGLVTAHSNTPIDASAVAALAAALLAYRIVYYLLPLCAAIGLSVGAEVIRSRATPATPHLGDVVAATSSPMAPDAI
jgi:uncharacterized membrane protein YbhN (UPF0104 family)